MMAAKFTTILFFAYQNKKLSTAVSREFKEFRPCFLPVQAQHLGGTGASNTKHPTSNIQA
jgi:hypothetical protein